jgi:ABC-type Fe2+-enterobactin transport system substrate-binding protein
VTFLELVVKNRIYGPSEMAAETNWHWPLAGWGNGNSEDLQTKIAAGRCRSVSGMSLTGSSCGLDINITTGAESVAALEVADQLTFMEVWTGVGREREREFGGVARVYRDTKLGRKVVRIRILVILRI